MELNIRVIVKKVGKPAEVKIVHNELQDLKYFVNGMLEVVQFFPLKGVCIICDDEGKLKGYKGNMLYPEIEDVICGDFVFAGVDFYSGNMVSLTDEQINFLLKYIKIFEL